jgi:hypothetical protein
MQIGRKRSGTEQTVQDVRHVVRYVWRPKELRDLPPTKDVKGGSSVTGESKPITRGTGTTAHPKKKQVTTYEIRPRVNGNGCDLISDVLRFGSLWFAGPKGDLQRDSVRKVQQPVA